jgi:CheY-like chemotaxis protein
LPNKTILFADDSATMRTILETTFAAEAINVVTVPSGEAAVAKAREISPAVVIADAGMPGMSGYDVCKAIRAEERLKGTPVIIMSGVSSPYDESRGREAGATEHIKKPFDTTKLIERIAELAGAAPAPAVAAPGPVAATAPQPVARAPIPAPAAPAPSPAPLTPQAAPVSRPLTTGGPSAAGSPRGPGATTHKETMIFGADTPRPAPTPEVKPIEIEVEPSGAAAGSFQVGTLAELAQMDDKGRPVAPDVAGRELELDEPEGPPLTERVVQRTATAAAAEVAARVGGLTAEQVEAIRALTAEVVERVVWEVVPDLAEAMIRERIAELLEE